jgi:hypothetical protein
MVILWFYDFMNRVQGRDNLVLQVRFLSERRVELNWRSYSSSLSTLGFGSLQRLLWRTEPSRRAETRSAQNVCLLYTISGNNLTTLLNPDRWEKEPFFF